MKKKGLYYLILTAFAVTLVGCNSGKNNSTDNVQSNEAVETTEAADMTLDDTVVDAMNELYAIQINYSNGTAPLNIIPTPTVEVIYDNWDAIEMSGIKEAPISLREYVDPSIVYFDYESNYSIKWNKDENDVTVEETNIADREDYKQKQHKGMER